MLSTVLNKGVLISTLHASNQKQLLKPAELDIYYEPEPTLPAERPSPTPEFLYEYIHAGREGLTNMFTGLLTTHEKVSDFYSTTKGKVSNTYTRILEDPYFLISPAAITAATVTGAALAGKGKRPVKRSLYGLLFGTTAAAVSYPQRSFEIAQTGYYHTTTSLSQLFAPSGPTTTERVVEVLDKKTEAEETGSVEISEVVVATEDAHTELVANTEETESSVADAVPAADAECPAVEEEVLAESTDIVEVQSPEMQESSSDRISDVTVISNTKQDETSEEEEVAPPGEDNNLEYDPGQTELQEITIVSVDDNVENKNMRLDFDLTNQEEDVFVVEGDLGQSDPDDSDMYSTRS